MRFRFFGGVWHLRTIMGRLRVRMMEL